MPLAAARQVTMNTASVVDSSLAERRRYRREAVALAGRQFEPAQNREVTCKIADISPGGARVLSGIVPPPGTRLVVYIEGFGRFDGSIARAAEDGFGLEFTCTALKRERVAADLAHYVGGGSLENFPVRRHERARRNGAASFTRANGDVVPCTMLDFSLSGVSLATTLRPPVGEIVLISQIAGRVARHHDNGIAIEFLPLPGERVRACAHAGAKGTKAAAQSPRPKLSAAG
jgi:hypothetical protein